MKFDPLEEIGERAAEAVGDAVLGESKGLSEHISEDHPFVADTLITAASILTGVPLNLVAKSTTWAENLGRGIARFLPNESERKQKKRDKYWHQMNESISAAQHFAIFAHDAKSQEERAKYVALMEAEHRKGDRAMEKAFRFF